jgi:hypothetical protein
LFAKLNVTVRVCETEIVKSVRLVAVPPGVVTVIRPVVAPLGTVAVIWVAEFTVNVAARPLNLTAEAPVRFVPMIETLVPTLPLVGENDVIVGTPVTVKLVALFAVTNPGTETWSGPLVAPDGTVAVIWLDEFTVNDAGVVLNITEFAPQKFRPVMTTLAPTAPLVGTNDVMDGCASATTVKLPALAVSAPAVSTVIVPVEAPTGTVAVARASDGKLKTAAGVPPPPLNVTPVAPVNPDPVMLIAVPTGPQTGVNELTDAADAGVAVKSSPIIPSASASANFFPRDLTIRIPMGPPFGRR